MAGTKSERNAAAEPQTEARRFCGQSILPLVTNAWFAEWNGRGREALRSDRQRVKRSKRRVGHGAIK
jgi:hypothetical protein